MGEVKQAQQKPTITKEDFAKSLSIEHRRVFDTMNVLDKNISANYSVALRTLLDKKLI